MEKTISNYYNSRSNSAVIIATIFKREMFEIDVFKFHCNEELKLLCMKYYIKNGKNRF